MTENLRRAELLLQQDRYQQAEGELRLYLAGDPENGYAHALLAWCLVKLERYVEAEAEARQAVALAPASSFGYQVLGNLLLRLEYPDQATQAIDEGLRVDPTNSDLFALRGHAALQRYRWQEALDAARAGLQHDPGNIDCINVQGQALVKLGRKEEAARALGGALAQAPENSYVHANRGWALLHERKPKEALEHFREALRLDPQNEFARAGMVEALKARNIIYRVMLSFFLWMARLPPRWQIGIVLGGFLGMRLLRQAAIGMPALQPFVLPIIVAYVFFAVMTWIADPLFNLLLQIDRFGRLALSREQRIGSTVFGVVLALALLGGLGFLVLWLANVPELFLIPFMAAGIVFGLSLLPVSAIWRCQAGAPRMIMGTYTVGLIALGLFTFTAGAFMPEQQFGNLASMFGVGVFISQFVATGLASIQVRVRPK